MSTRTLPLLFINLGGEMLYILDQRLQAQNVAADKAKKVMTDIVTAMFSKVFMEEVFKPQDLYSTRTLKTVLTRLAHSSIMRLNQASMDKLYDLMTMAFKCQVLLCPRPRDLLLVTLNHMDTVRAFVSDAPAVLNQVNEIHRRLIETYMPLSDGEFQLIRQSLLNFFQDMHIRVSIFLQDKVQNSSGHFVLETAGPVPYGSEVPGLIRMFNSMGKEVKRRHFPSGGCYSSAVREGSLEMSGDRSTNLGTNMYSVTRQVETQASKNSSQRTKVNLAPNLLAKEELNLLARLMGGLQVQNPAKVNTVFRVNLFTTDDEEDKAFLSRPEEMEFEVINIQAMKDQQANAELAQIMGEFREEEEPSQGLSSKGEDLLALMDGL